MAPAVLTDVAHAVTSLGAEMRDQKHRRWEKNSPREGGGDPNGPRSHIAAADREIKPQKDVDLH